MGSGYFGCKILDYLCGKVDIDLVVTQPPKPAGRGLKPKDTPVGELAIKKGIPLLKVKSLDEEEAIKTISPKECDVILVIDYGGFVKEPYLSAPLWGCLNVHPSLLPKYRGAAPIQRALMAGEAKTGVTIFRLNDRMDAGPICKQVSVDIDIDDTAGDLYERLSLLGAKLLLECLKEIAEGRSLLFIPQDEEKATYAPKIQKQECLLDFSMSALDFHNKVRALFPKPAAYFVYARKRVKLLKTKYIEKEFLDIPYGTICGVENDMFKVACGGGVIGICKVQEEGKKAVSGSAWLNGKRLKVGDKIC